jgi:hypothetical protein
MIAPAVFLPTNRNAGRRQPHLHRPVNSQPDAPQSGAVDSAEIEGEWRRKLALHEARYSRLVTATDPPPHLPNP